MTNATATTETSTEQLTLQLRNLIVELWDNSASDIAHDYALLITQGDRDKLTASIQEFQRTLDERNAYLLDDNDEDEVEAIAERVLSKINRILKDGFNENEARNIRKELQEVYSQHGEHTTTEDLGDRMSDMLHQFIFTSNEIDVIDEMYENPLESDDWERITHMAILEC